VGSQAAGTVEQLNILENFMGISIWQLLIILAIVLIIFGAKKLRNLGGDVGGAIKNFKQSMKEEEEEQAKPEAGKKGEAKKISSDSGNVIEGEVVSKKKNRS